LDNTTFVALSRQMTLRRELDIVANNIANADTAGFKVESLMTGDEQRRPAKDVPLDHPVRFTLDTGVARDFGQGALSPPATPSTWRWRATGFFSVTTRGRPRYTRDGRLGMDAAGPPGHQGRAIPVLDDGGAEITSAAGGPPSISPNGTVSQGQRWSARSPWSASRTCPRSPRRATAATPPTAWSPSRPRRPAQARHGGGLKRPARARGGQTDRTFPRL
jgi:flagellar basal-body rod protein FlgF